MRLIAALVITLIIVIIIFLFVVKKIKKMANKEKDGDKKPNRPKPIYQWFTSVPQEWFVIVVKGQEFHKIINGIKNWHWDDETFRFKRNDENTPEPEYDPIWEIFGLRFVGIPGIHGLYRYKFAWNKFWRKDDKNPEYEVSAHDVEEISYTPFESQYPIPFSGIEVRAKGKENNKKGNNGNEDDDIPISSSEEALVPIGFVVTVRVRMIDPIKALMQNTDWFGNVLNPNLELGLRNFAGDKTYDQMIKSAKETVSREFSEYILGDTRKSVLEEAGVDIISASITKINPNDKFEEALLNLAKQQREAEAKVVTEEANKKALKLQGEGEAIKIKLIAEADAERIEKTTLAIAQAGEGAITVEKWRQIHGSGLTTYVEGEGGKKVSIVLGPDGKPAK